MTKPLHQEISEAMERSHKRGILEGLKMARDILPDEYYSDKSIDEIDRLIKQYSGDE